MNMITSMSFWSMNTATCMTSIPDIIMLKRHRSRIHTGIGMSLFDISIRTIPICITDIDTVRPAGAGTD